MKSVLVDDYRVFFGPFDLVIQREEIAGRDRITIRGKYADGDLGPPWCCTASPCEIEMINA